MADPSGSSVIVLNHKEVVNGRRRGRRRGPSVMSRISRRRVAIKGCVGGRPPPADKSTPLNRFPPPETTPWSVRKRQDDGVTNGSYQGQRPRCPRLMAPPGPGSLLSPELMYGRGHTPSRGYQILSNSLERSIFG